MISAPLFSSAICSDIPVPPAEDELQYFSPLRKYAWHFTGQIFFGGTLSCFTSLCHGNNTAFYQSITIDTNGPSSVDWPDELLAFLPYLQTQLPVDTHMTVTVTVTVTADLVGVIMRTIGPSPSSNSSWSAMWRNRGSRKARVLPGRGLSQYVMASCDCSHVTMSQESRHDQTLGTTRMHK